MLNHYFFSEAMIPSYVLIPDRTISLIYHPFSSYFYLLFLLL